jgi:hypothetical protein
MSAKTDGVKVFASWKNQGMTGNRQGRRKRPRTNPKPPTGLLRQKSKAKTGAIPIR